MSKYPIDRTSIRQLLILQTLGGFSQWLDIFLIFSVPAFAWNATPAQMAFIAACFGLPGLFLAPLAGALLDSLDPRRAAWRGAMLRSALTGLMAFAPGWEMFAALVFCKGLANVFYWPATSILTQRIVGSAQRLNYFSHLSALDQFTKLLTPLVAGASTQIGDAQWLFLLSAALTLVSAWMIHRLPASAAGARTPPEKLLSTAWSSLVTGGKSLALLSPALRCSIAVGIGVSLALALYDPHLAAYLHASGFAPATFSWLMSATAGGAICGAMAVRFLGHAFPSTRLVQGGMAVFFVATSSAAIFSSLHVEQSGSAVLACIWFINGLGYEMLLIASSVTLQNLCPPSLIGRVSTSARSLQMLVVVTGPLLGAWLIGRHSRAAPFAASALLVGLLLLATARCFRGGLRA